MERVGAGALFEVVVDYAHTPAALEAVLPHLRSTHPDGRIIVVVGSAGERDLLKRPWMGHVAARLADVVVLTVEDPRDEAPSAPVEQMAAGARAAGAVDRETLHLVLDRREAVRAALSMAGEGDCVLLAGKGHERTIAWAWGDEPWDEAAVAREALADLEGSSAGAESG
jgi:UDP-N-acetylmuramoyl-L-alanyl-D-glutamate--2,6-diaminopimelate ligase